MTKENNTRIIDRNCQYGVLEMPEQYKFLAKRELVCAFFGTYCELLANHTKNSSKTPYDLMYYKIKQYYTSNSLLWRHLWLEVYRIQFERLNCLYAVKTVNLATYNVDSYTSEEFGLLINKLEKASVSQSKPPFSCLQGPRLFASVMLNINFYKESEKLRALLKKKIAESNISIQELKTKWPIIDENPYFDIEECFIDRAIIDALTGHAVDIALKRIEAFFSMDDNTRKKIFELVEQIY